MVWHVLSWGLVLLLGLGWTFLCWAAQAVLGWEGWRKGLDWTEHVPEIKFPDWLPEWAQHGLGLDWIRWARDWLVEYGPGLQEQLAGLPDISGWLVAGVWLIWGVGAFLLLLLGVVLSVVIALMQRHSPARVAA